MTAGMYSWQSSVISSILEQGRAAMLSGKPILYIKSDSRRLINRIVSEKQRPLVVLRTNTGEQKDRPLAEEHGEMNVLLEGNSGDCIVGLGSLPGDRHTLAPDYPRMWVMKMPEDSENLKDRTELASTFEKLEQFIDVYTNPTYGDGPGISGAVSREILHSSVILLYGETVRLNSYLRTYTEIIDIPYPREKDIEAQVRAQTGNPPELSEKVLDELVANLLGFQEEEIEICLQRILTSTTLDDLAGITEIIKVIKKQKMESGDLEWCIPKSQIAGMVEYQKWVEKLCEPMKHSAQYRRERGSSAPKGVLLCGIPGCGKSEAAKFTAKTLGLSLLKLDMGKMMNKLQGESERKLRENIALAEVMSPTVLWLDEIEKAMSASKSGGSGDNGVFMRMFAFLLTWMQENTKPVFLFATSNDISGLPKEFFRSGRFDELFAVYLPMEAECVAIFKACMARAWEDAAYARGIRQKEMQLFEDDCWRDELFSNLICGMMRDGRPRIMIGSDIQKIVTVALREVSVEEGGVIRPGAWETALQAACENSSVYGDGDENVDSIAVSYCRLLRKGFRPTADSRLFCVEDYHGRNLSKVLAKQKNPELYPNEDVQILQRRKPNTQSKYDQAVYELLYERINELAPIIEQNAKNELAK